MGSKENIQNFIRGMDGIRTYARHNVFDALSGKLNGQEHVLLRWMIENDINAVDVFADPETREKMSTYEGINGLIDDLYYGLENDKVRFIKTAGGHPFVVTNIGREEDLHQRLIQLRGPHTIIQETEDDLRPVESLSNVNHFIAEFEAFARVNNLYPSTTPSL